MPVRRFSISINVIRMTEANEVWNRLGDIEEQQALHVLHLLFEQYEQKMKNGVDADEARKFFDSLGRAIEGACSCNASRR